MNTTDTQLEEYVIVTSKGILGFLTAGYLKGIELDQYIQSELSLEYSCESILQNSSGIRRYSDDFMECVKESLNYLTDKVPEPFLIHRFIIDSF